MADSIIGSLRVLLGIDTAAFTEGLGNAEGILTKFGKAIENNLGKIAGAVSLGAITTGITAAVKSSINAMDDLGKSSQKIGIPVETLSSLRVAAELSDVSVEALGRSMGKLTTAMVATAAGGTGPATAAFQALGISMETLKSNDPSKVLEAMAAKFATFQDGATKSALASAILGQRMGRELIPLLNEGAEGLRKARENAEAFGQVVSTKTTRQAQDFNDNLKLMSLIPSGIANELAKTLLPKLVELSNQMVEWAKSNNVVKNSADVLIRIIALIADNVVFLAKAFAAFIAIKLGLFFIQLALQIYEFAKAMYAAGIAATVMSAPMLALAGTILAIGAAVLYASGYLDKFVEKAKGIGTAILESIPTAAISDTLKSGLEAIGVNLRALGGNLDGVKTHGDAAAEALKNLKPPPAFDPAGAAGAAKFTEELLKIQLKAREIKGDFDQLAPGFVQAAIHLKLIKDTGDGFSGTLDTLSPKMIQLNDALYKLAGANITAANRTPWEEFLKTQNQINEAFARNAIGADTFGAASLKNANKMIEAYGNAAATAAGNFGEFFKTFAKGNKEMFLIYKAFAISQALINTFVGATKALEAGPILGPILMASVIALGLAQVAKIVAEKPPAMATGGTMMLGGSGGVDSQMVPVMMSPGEKVTVDQNKYGSDTSGSKVITVQGIKSKEFFTGDVMRDFIENLNIAISDGYKIKVA